MVAAIAVVKKADITSQILFVSISMKRMYSNLSPRILDTLTTSLFIRLTT